MKTIQNGNMTFILSIAIVYMYWFQKHLCHNKSIYVENDCVWIDVDAVISIVLFHVCRLPKLIHLMKVMLIIWVHLSITRGSSLVENDSKNIVGCICFKTLKL